MDHERRGADIGLTRAETLKPGLLAEGCLAVMRMRLLFRRHRDRKVERMLLSIAASISNCLFWKHVTVVSVFL
jgi:hypothetical protein